jgi:DNA (cytosine-5)-methyltransferase 1
MAFAFIDLFAGIGGFHAALQPLGGKCVYVSEWDEHAASTYAKNWLKGNGLEVQGDIRKVTEGGTIKVPVHDVLTAGFPCQPFSKSGYQLGVNETRGTLFYNILRIVESKKPKIILLENVRNLVGPKHIDDYKTMIRLLRDLGYAVSDTPTILSPHEIPKNFGGSPQHRQRVFIGAVKVGKKRAAELSNIGPLIDKEFMKRFTQPKWNIKSEIASISGATKLDLKKLKISPEQIKALAMWEDFLIQFRKNNNTNPPGLPMWTDYWKSRKQIRIPRDTPDWKRDFIERNIKLYESNKTWINKWMKKHNISEFITSNRKFEWQGKNSKSIYECLIQFRPSGIRVKEPTYVPAFVAITQTPVLGWEFRELSEREAILIQGFPKKFNFENQRRALSLKQTGNAVHPGSAALVFCALIERALALKLPWAKSISTGAQEILNRLSSLQAETVNE